MYGTEPDIASPRYNEHVFRVPWHFVISGNHWIFVRRKKGMGKIHLVVIVHMYLNRHFILKFSLRESSKIARKQRIE